jgi:hypothetical protein
MRRWQAQPRLERMEMPVAYDTDHRKQDEAQAEDDSRRCPARELPPPFGATLARERRFSLLSAVYAP